MLPKLKQLGQNEKLVPVATVILFFGLHLIIGLLIYKDHGVSTDERTDNSRGQLNYERIIGEDVNQFLDKCSQSKNICYYPSLFSVLSVLSRSSDSRDVYLRRSLITFAFFAFSVFVFFLIGKKIFKDWKIGLLGSLFLILSPRIFASSFYNPKDIPFLSSYIIVIYTLLLLLEKKTIYTAILHGIAAGIECSIRTPGLVVIPITAFFLIDFCLSKRDWKSFLKVSAIFCQNLSARG